MKVREMTGIGDFFACALKKAIEGRAKVYNYDDPEDFARLWELGAPSTDCETNDTSQGCSSGGHVVLVWDGRSSRAETGGEVPAQEGETEVGQPARSEKAGAAEQIAEHLTPLDWALAFSVKALRCEQIPKIAISIVDLTGKDHDEWAFRWRYQLLAQMPWVTLHAPLIPSANAKPAAFRAGYRPILGETEEQPLLCCDGGTWKLTACPTLASSKNSRAVKSLRELIESWAATAVRTRDHHDLNNIVGPWLLVEAASNDRWIDAFRQKMKWSGLSVDPAGHGSSEADGETAPEGSVDDQTVASGTPCYNVLAIDDMLSRGWDKVILEIFGATGNENSTAYSQMQQICDGSRSPHIFGSTSADMLLNALGWRDGSEADCANYRTRCFDSPIPDKARTPWMLALDLMLFSGRTSAERNWIGKLLNVAEKVSKIREAHPAWPGFSDRELKAVRKWLKASSSPDDPGYETALSLFPRLCALRWPVVPILLFSATGRRGLIAGLVETYGNVFAAPAKPDLLGDGVEERIKGFYAGWRSTIEKARGYVSVQKELIRLMSGNEAATSGIAGDSPCAASDNGNAVEGANDQEHGQLAHGNANHRHLTIAFEESGNFSTDQHSAIGGVIIEATGSNEFSAMEMTCAFLEALRSEHVEFYNHPPVYTDIYENDIGGSQHPILAIPEAGNRGRIGAASGCIIEKGSNISNAVNIVLGRYDNIRLAAFRCLIPKTLYEHPGLTDGTYLKWLARTIELLLCEYLPSSGIDDLPLDSRHTTLSIWLPTRVVAATGDQSIQRDQYFDTMAGMLHTVGGYSVAYEIVLRALEGRQEVETVLGKSRLKLRKIPYAAIPYAATGNPERPYESALHWYCTTHSTFAFPVSRRTAHANAPTCRVNVNGDPGEHQDCGLELVADYSVAQHLADACLTKILHTFPSSEIENGWNITRSISFDVDAGEVLEEFLAAGRLFDVGRGLEAFETSFCRDWFFGVFNGRNGLTAPVDRRIQEKCREYALSIGGREIEKLAASRTE